VDWLSRHRFSRLSAILAIYVTMFLAVYILIVYGLPVLLKEMEVFVDAVPELVRKVQDLLMQSNRLYQRLPIPESIRQVVDETLISLQMSLTEGVRQMINGLWTFIIGLLHLALAPLLAFYFLKDAAHIRARLRSVVPEGWRADVLHLWSEVDRVLTKFIRGHVLVALLVGILTTTGFLVLGVEFAVLLGIIAGIADLIPYFGPVIGAVPAVALSALQSWQLAIYVIILVLVIQQLESSIISPKILGDSVGLHPVVVIFVLMAGGKLFGVLGMLFAVPGAAILRIIANYLYRKVVR